MNPDHIKLSQLRSLVAVAGCGNFGEAGLRLGISQSAVSHAIATLEDELGVVLFARGRYGARLTPVGERMLEHAQAMLQLLDMMERETNLAKGLHGGQVRVAAFRSFATHILPEIIMEFSKSYPAITLSITECRGDDDIEQELREGKVDIGFTCVPTPAEFEVQELFSDDYIALFPPLVEVPECITWEDLKAYPVIFPPERDFCSIIMLDYLARLKQNITPAYRIAEDSTIVSMVMRGLGTAIMARLAAEPLPAAIQARSLPVPLARIIRIVTLEGALHPPGVYAFLDVIKSTLQRKHFPTLKQLRVPVHFDCDCEVAET